MPLVVTLPPRLAAPVAATLVAPTLPVVTKVWLATKAPRSLLVPLVLAKPVRVRFFPLPSILLSITALAAPAFRATAAAALSFTPPL